MTHRTKI